MLPEEGPSLNVEVSLVTLKLKQRIVAYLENQYRKTGTDAVSWRGIWIESGATEEEFRKALNAAAETGIVFTDSDHIRLRFSARLKNRLLPTNAESSNTTTLLNRSIAVLVCLSVCSSSSEGNNTSAADPLAIVNPIGAPRSDLHRPPPGWTPGVSLVSLVAKVFG